MRPVLLSVVAMINPRKLREQNKKDLAMKDLQANGTSSKESKERGSIEEWAVQV